MRILITEDDFIARRVLTQHLNEFGECDIATDGQEAVEAVRLALAANQPYDLICLDIMMPTMSGQEALKAIRCQEAEHGITDGKGAKVIMTTAMSDPRNVMNAFNAQCEAYLVKPITKGQLLKQMEDLHLLPGASPV